MRCQVLECEPPSRLAYSWSAGVLEEDARPVTVGFEPVAHLRIDDRAGFDMSQPVQIPPTMALATVGGICRYERVGTTRRLLNFFSSGLGLLHCSHPSLTWFELPRSSQQRQAGRCASVRPAARGGDLAATPQILRHGIDSANFQEKP